MLSLLRRLLWSLATVLSLSTCASVAASPRAATPHPRIYLTPTKLNELRSKVAAGDADWLELKSRADAMLSYRVPPFDRKARMERSINYSYQGAGWHDAVFVLGLAYRLTGNPAYAAKAKEVVDVVLAAGLPPLTVDSGYPTRHLPASLAFAYDWLYDYLDQPTKKAIVATVNGWFDWYRTTAYNRNDATGTGNYFGGHLFGFGLAGLATMGENQRADEINRHIRDKWDRDVRRAFSTGGFAGGYPVESFSYGTANFKHLLGYALAVRSATGEDLLGDYGGRIATALIYNLKPNRWQASDEGTQSLNYGWVMQGSLPLLLSSLLPGAEGDEMAFYYGNLAATPVSAATSSIQKPRDYERLLFMTSRPRGDYRAWRPLHHRSAGDEHFISRSDWSDSAIWSSFNAGAAHYANHQQQCAGHISIQRGDDYLLVDPGQWRGERGFAGRPVADVLSSVAANTLFVEGGNEPGGGNPLFEGGQRWYGKSDVLRYEATAGYLYAKADLTSAYAGKDRAADTVKLFQRSYLSFGGGRLIFVYDRVRAASAGVGKRLQWYLNRGSRPTVEGNLVTAEVGGSRLTLKTVFPPEAATKLSVDPPTKRGPIYGKRIEVSGPSSTAFDPLTVIFTSGHAGEAPAIAGIEADTMLGALVASKTPQLVLFAKNGLPQRKAAFRVGDGGGGNVEHLLLDMEPGSYDIYRNGALRLAGVAASPQGTLAFSLPAGSISVVRSGKR